MSGKTFFRAMIFLLAAAVLCGLPPSLEHASAARPETAGSSWDGYLTADHIGVTQQEMRNIISQDGIRGFNYLAKGEYLVRVEIQSTGGGKASRSEVLLQFGGRPLAAVGKAWADTRNVNMAAIGNLNSCPLQQGAYYPGHVCAKKFNGQGWMDVSAAVGQDNRALIINNPNTAWKGGAIVWFAFDARQNRIPYDIIEKRQGQSFGFGRITARKYHVRARPTVAKYAPAAPAPAAYSIRGSHVFIVGMGGVGTAFSVHRWTGSSWADMPGGAIDITVDSSGKPWIIDANHAIHRWTGTSWAQVPGNARDIGAGGGKVYIVGMGAKSGGYSIHRWTGTGWVEIPGGAFRITADNRGYPWITDGANAIHHRTGTAWAQLPGNARDIGAGGGQVYIIGMGGSGAGYSIHRWTGAAWADMPGGGVWVDADKNGTPWIVDSNHSIHYWTGTSWATMAGNARAIGAE